MTKTNDDLPFKAEVGAYSSVVGGGVLLVAHSGRMVGQIAFLCHDDTLRDRAMQERLSCIISDAINAARVGSDA